MSQLIKKLIQFPELLSEVHHFIPIDIHLLGVNNKFREFIKNKIIVLYYQNKYIEILNLFGLSINREFYYSFQENLLPILKNLNIYFLPTNILYYILLKLSPNNICYYYTNKIQRKLKFRIQCERLGFQFMKSYESFAFMSIKGDNNWYVQLHNGEKKYVYCFSNDRNYDKENLHLIFVGILVSRIHKKPTEDDYY